MGNKADKKKVVGDIRKEIEASKGTLIGGHYVNALKLISQVLFTSSSGFILELIQNAEDSGLGLRHKGVFELYINSHRVKVVHNGRPFSENDVKDLCGIGSSKKPERGTLGYLGIGFKSVFKVTDRPEIYSNGYQFKFDRDAWDSPADTPWQVIPIWIDEPSQPIETEKTTFIIPYRDREAHYSRLINEVKKLKTDLYLFLRWLKNIVVIDEDSGQEWTLENEGETQDGITILKHDDDEQRFKFFRRVVHVPDEVKQDRLTQECKRANVSQREIAIAFALDEEGNLAPSEAGAMYGGVYSFLPLGEARSGAQFPIQADFLVQPGRDAINYEATWNHWLTEEVADLCEEAICYFKNHDKWKYQFLPVFEFNKSEGLESYDSLFGPKLIEPIERFLDEDACVPTEDGRWAKPALVVQLTEDEKATQDLIAKGILREDQIAPVLGGQPDLKLVAPGVRGRASRPFTEVDRLQLLRNKAFLEERCQGADAASWFRALYRWLSENRIWIITQAYKDRRVNQHEYSTRWAPLDGRTYRARIESYHSEEFVLTADMRLLKGGEVSLFDSPPPDPTLKDLADTLHASKSMLHRDILADVKDEAQQRALKGFLTGYTGVQILDSKAVCREALLPKILTGAPRPSSQDLLKYTSYCQRILGDEEMPRGYELWVLTNRGSIKAANEVLFSLGFKPEQDWQTHQRYVSGLSFVSSRYVAGVTGNDDLKAWSQFFKAGGVKDAPDNGVEEFAMKYAEKKLNSKCKSVVPVDKRNFGYDLEAVTLSGEKMYVEVKGQSSEKDVELTENETQAADKHKDSFYLCVVSSIPNNPSMYMVQNPAAPGIGRKDKLTISVNTWRAAKW